MRYIIIFLSLVTLIAAFTPVPKKANIQQKLDYEIPDWVYKQVFDKNKRKPLVKLDQENIKKIKIEIDSKQRS